MKRVRKLAKLHGPGTIPEKELYSDRARLDLGKNDYFLEFAN